MKNNPRHSNPQGGAQGYTSQDQNPQYQGSQNRIPQNQNPQYQGSKDQNAQSKSPQSWGTHKANEDGLTSQQRPRQAEGEDKYAAAGRNQTGFEPTGQRGDLDNRARGTEVPEGDDSGRTDMQAQKGRSVQPANTPIAHSHR